MVSVSPLRRLELASILFSRFLLSIAALTMKLLWAFDRRRPAATFDAHLLDKSERSLGIVSTCDANGIAIVSGVIRLRDPSERSSRAAVRIFDRRSPIYIEDIVHRPDRDVRPPSAPG